MTPLFFSFLTISSIVETSVFLTAGLFFAISPKAKAAHQRRRLAHKVSNPRLLKIHFHTLRYWKGTMLYHETKDIYYVMQKLGHKNIKNTLLYIQLEEALFQGETNYISKVAKTEKDICSLVEAGFEYVTEFEGSKIFRKRKL